MRAKSYYKYVSIYRKDKMNAWLTNKLVCCKHGSMHNIYSTTHSTESFRIHRLLLKWTSKESGISLRGDSLEP